MEVFPPEGAVNGSSVDYQTETNSISHGKRHGQTVSIGLYVKLKLKLSEIEIDKMWNVVSVEANASELQWAPAGPKKPTLAIYVRPKWFYELGKKKEKTIIFFKPTNTA